MKRYITFVLFIFITVGTWASGVTEVKPVHTYRISTSSLAYESSKSTQVEPSSDILAIFADDDNDVDDIYGDVEPYLHMGADRKEITKEIITYINSIIVNDVDDISDLINSELTSALKSNGVEESYMILGATKITCSLDYLQ
ncbi:MAG: hypothetical protein JXR64_07125 [Spirochaetales bacterium]|nr:hypothetical protein [Spirochaetales bacterium]